MKLMGYDFVIEYKPGKENIVADALFAISQQVPLWLTSIQEEVQSNSNLQDIVKLVQNQFFKDRIFLLSESPLVPVIVNEIHSSTHEGFFKTFQRIRSVFYWKGMKKKYKGVYSAL